MNKSSLSVCILASLLLVICSSALAQDRPTDTGSIILSGGASLSSMGGELYGEFDDDSGDRTILVSGNGSAGLFVLPGLALGGEALFTRESYQDYSQTTWGLGPQLSLFVGGLQPGGAAAGAIYPFLTGSFLYTRTTTEIGITDWFDQDLFAEDQKSTDTLITVRLGGGLCFMLTNTVGLVLEANYEVDSMQFDEEEVFEEESLNGNKFNVIAGITAFVY